MATPGAAGPAGGAAEGAAPAATAPQQGAEDQAAPLRSPEITADTAAVERVAGQWERAVEDFRRLTGQARHLAGVRPLQHGDSDHTWDTFAEKWKPDADALPDSLDELATALQSLPDNLRRMAKEDARTEAQNIQLAQQLGRALRE